MCRGSAGRSGKAAAWSLSRSVGSRAGAGQECSGRQQRPPPVVKRPSVPAPSVSSATCTGHREFDTLYIQCMELLTLPLCLCLSVWLSDCFSMHLPSYMSVYLMSFCQICLCIRLSVCLPICLYIYIFICQSFFVLFFFLCVYVCVYPPLPFNLQNYRPTTPEHKNTQKFRMNYSL